MHSPDIQRTVHDGVQKLYFFDNDYGASVVRHEFSYGSESGLWELAVLKYTGEGDRENFAHWDLTYDTPITGDVLGCLTEGEIESLLDQIQGLSD